MVTQKLFKITTKKGESGSPDVNYMLAINEKMARNRYCHYELGSDRYFDFTVVGELQPTQENKLAIVYENFLHNDSVVKHNLSWLLEVVKSGKKLDEFWENAYDVSNTLINLQDYYNVSVLHKMVAGYILGKNIEYGVRVAAIQKDIKGNELLLADLARHVNKHLE